MAESKIFRRLNFDVHGLVYHLRRLRVDIDGPSDRLRGLRLDINGLNNRLRWLRFTFNIDRSSDRFGRTGNLDVHRFHDVTFWFIVVADPSAAIMIAACGGQQDASCKAEDGELFLECNWERKG